MTPHSGIRHAAVRVKNLSESLRFWKELLGFSSYREKESDWAMVSRGETSLSLVTAGYDSDSKATSQAQGGIHHLGITVHTPAEVDAWHTRLSQGKDQWPALQIKEPKLHRDESYGFYFLDIDGNAFEIIFIPVLHREERNLPSVILLGHGSRDPRWPLPILKLRDLLQAEHPSLDCEVAWMEFAEPTLDDALLNLQKRSANPQVEIIPIFISAGGHVSHDLPNLVSDAAARFPQFTLLLKGPIGEELSVLHAMKTRVLESLTPVK